MTKIYSACALIFLLPSLAFAGDFERGVEALDKKDYDVAIACFTACIRDNPRSAEAFYNRGIANINKNEYHKGIEDYSEAIRLAPEDAKAYYNRGTAYYHQKKYDKAIEDYSQTIRLNPKFAAASYNNRGLAYTYKNEDDKAIEDYSQAIRLDPKYAKAFYNRGNVYRVKHEYDKTIDDYSQAIRLDPNYVAAHNSLATVLATCPKEGVRDGKTAVEHATKACELTQWMNANILDTLAAAHAENGNFKEAVKRQQEAIEIGYGDKEDLKKARQRLKQYQEGKPYRDE